MASIWLHHLVMYDILSSLREHLHTGETFVVDQIIRHFLA